MLANNFGFILVKRMHALWKMTQANNNKYLYSESSDGRVARASTSEAVDSDLIPSRVKPMTLKLVFTASMLDDQYETDSVKNKHGKGT